MFIFFYKAELEYKQSEIVEEKVFPDMRGGEAGGRQSDIEEALGVQMVKTFDWQRPAFGSRPINTCISLPSRRSPMNSLRQSKS